MSESYSAQYGFVEYSGYLTKGDSILFRCSSNGYQGNYCQTPTASPAMPGAGYQIYRLSFMSSSSSYSGVMNGAAMAIGTASPSVTAVTFATGFYASGDMIPKQSYVTRTQDAVNGDTFTINSAGFYTISCSGHINPSGSSFITNNGASTTALDSTSYSIIIGTNAGASNKVYDHGFSTTAYFNAGDVVRCHVAAGSSLNSNFASNALFVHALPSGDSIRFFELSVSAVPNLGTSATALSYQSSTIVSNQNLIAYVQDTIHGDTFTVEQTGFFTILVNIGCQTSGTIYYLTRNAASGSVLVSDASVIATRYVYSS